MGDRLGHLIHSAYGSKVRGFNGLSQLLQDEINALVHLYKNVPKALLDREDVTPWMYFKQYFEFDLAGDTFPVLEIDELRSA